MGTTGTVVVQWWYFKGGGRGMTNVRKVVALALSTILNGQRKPRASERGQVTSSPMSDVELTALSWQRSFVGAS